MNKKREIRFRNHQNRRRQNPRQQNQKMPIPILLDNLLVITTLKNTVPDRSIINQTENQINRETYKQKINAEFEEIEGD